MTPASAALRGPRVLPLLLLLLLAASSTILVGVRGQTTDLTCVFMSELNEAISADRLQPESNGAGVVSGTLFQVSEDQLGTGSELDGFAALVQNNGDTDSADGEDVVVEIGRVHPARGELGHTLFPLTTVSQTMAQIRAGAEFNVAASGVAVSPLTCGGSYVVTVTPNADGVLTSSGEAEGNRVNNPLSARFFFTSADCASFVSGGTAISMTCEDAETSSRSMCTRGGSVVCTVQFNADSVEGRRLYPKDDFDFITSAALPSFPAGNEANYDALVAEAGLSRCAASADTDLLLAGGTDGNGGVAHFAAFVDAVGTTASDAVWVRQLQFGVTVAYNSVVRLLPMPGENSFLAVLRMRAANAVDLFDFDDRGLDGASSARAVAALVRYSEESGDPLGYSVFWDTATDTTGEGTAFDIVDAVVDAGGNTWLLLLLSGPLPPRLDPAATVELEDTFDAGERAWRTSVPEGVADPPPPVVIMDGVGDVPYLQVGPVGPADGSSHIELGLQLPVGAEPVLKSDQFSAAATGGHVLFHVSVNLRIETSRIEDASIDPESAGLRVRFGLDMGGGVDGGLSYPLAAARDIPPPGAGAPFRTYSGLVAVSGAFGSAGESFYGDNLDASSIDEVFARLSYMEFVVITGNLEPLTVAFDTVAVHRVEDVLPHAFSPDVAAVLRLPQGSAATTSSLEQVVDELVYPAGLDPGITTNPSCMCADPNVQDRVFSVFSRSSGDEGTTPAAVYMHFKSDDGASGSTAFTEIPGSATTRELATSCVVDSRGLLHVAFAARGGRSDSAEVVTISQQGFVLSSASLPGYTAGTSETNPVRLALDAADNVRVVYGNDGDFGGGDTKAPVVATVSRSLGAVSVSDQEAFRGGAAADRDICVGRATGLPFVVYAYQAESTSASPPALSRTLQGVLWRPAVQPFSAPLSTTSSVASGDLASEYTETVPCPTTDGAVLDISLVTGIDFFPTRQQVGAASLTATAASVVISAVFDELTGLTTVSEREFNSESGLGPYESLDGSTDVGIVVDGSDPPLSYMQLRGDSTLSAVSREAGDIADFPFEDTGELVITFVGRNTFEGDFGVGLLPAGASTLVESWLFPVSGLEFDTEHVARAVTSWTSGEAIENGWSRSAGAPEWAELWAAPGAVEALLLFASTGGGTFEADFISVRVAWSRGLYTAVVMAGTSNAVTPSTTQTSVGDRIGLSTDSCMSVVADTTVLTKVTDAPEVWTGSGEGDADGTATWTHTSVSPATYTPCATDAAGTPLSTVAGPLQVRVTGAPWLSALSFADGGGAALTPTPAFDATRHFPTDALTLTERFNAAALGDLPSFSFTYSVAMDGSAHGDTFVLDFALFDAARNSQLTVTRNGAAESVVTPPLTFTGMPAGTTTFVVTLAAGDGMQAEYTVVVDRTASTDATLNSVLMSDDTGAISTSWAEPGTLAEVELRFGELPTTAAATFDVAPLAQVTSITHPDEGSVAVNRDGLSASLPVPAAGDSASPMTVVIVAEDGSTTATYLLALDALGTLTDRESMTAVLQPDGSEVTTTAVADTPDRLVEITYETTEIALRNTFTEEALGQGPIEWYLASDSEGDVRIGGPYSSGELADVALVSGDDEGDDVPTAAGTYTNVVYVDAVPEAGTAYRRLTPIRVRRRLSSVTTVSGIEVRYATSDMTFALPPDEEIADSRITYTITVPREVTDIVLDPTATSPVASVYGCAACPGDGSAGSLGAPGSTTSFTFTVGAPDESETTYTVVVIRDTFHTTLLNTVEVYSAEPPEASVLDRATWEPPSAAASVGVADVVEEVWIRLYTLEEAFVSQVTLGSDIIFGPTSTNVGEPAIGEGSDAYSFDVRVPIGAGSATGTVTVSVLAEDGTTAAEFSLAVERLSTEAGVASAVAVPVAASGLAPVSFDMPAFEVEIPYEAADVSLQITLVDADGARIAAIYEEDPLGEGEVPESSPLGGPYGSGNTTAAMPTPSVGTFYFIAVVEPAAGPRYESVERIAITRLLSSLNTLSAITVTRTGTTETVALNEAFAPETTSYTASVARAVTSVSIAATPSSDAASVAVSPATLSMPVVNRAYVSTITVSAADGSTRTYRVSVKRVPSTDAAIGSIALRSRWQDSDLLPTPTVTSSSARTAAALLPHHAFEVYVAVQANSRFASVSVNGGEASVESASQLVSFITVAGTEVPITITAEDGTTQRTYTLTLRRRDRTSPGVSLSFEVPDGAAVPDMSRPAAAAVHDVAIFCGGSTAAGEPTASCLAMPSATPASEHTLSVARGGAAAGVAGDFVVVAGGSLDAGGTAVTDAVDVIAVSSATQAVRYLGSYADDGVVLSEPRRHAVGASTAAAAYIIGGADASGVQSCAVDRFVAAATFATAVAAGAGAGGNTTSTSSGPPVTASVPSGFSLWACRERVAAVGLGAYVIVAGGLASATEASDAVELYSEADDAVTDVGYLSEARYGMAYAASSDRAYFAGGWREVGGDLSRSLDIIGIDTADGATLRFIRTSMLYARADAIGFVVGGLFHTYGGRVQVCGSAGVLPCSQTVVDPPLSVGDGTEDSDGLFEPAASHAAARNSSARPRTRPRVAAVSAGSSTLRSAAATAVSVDGTRSYRTDDSSLSASSTRRRSHMGGTAPVVGGSALIAGGRTGRAGAAADAVLRMTPRLPCADLSFCHRSGTCRGEPPDEYCECFDGYEGESCALLAGTAKDVVRAVSIISTVGPAAVAVFGASSAAIGQAATVGLMPFLLFLQSMILPLQHNSDLIEVQQAFRALNSVTMNSPSDAPGSEDDGNVFEWSHGLLRKALILVGFGLVTIFLTGKLVHCCVFRMVLRAGHFVFLGVVLVVPLAESMLDIPQLPEYGAFVVYGGFVLLLWAIAIVVVRPRLDYRVRLHIMPGRGWASLKRKHRLANGGRNEQGEREKRGFLDNLKTRNLAERWRGTKEQFSKLEVRFAIMDPPEIGPREEDRDVNMYASQSFTWWRNAQKKAVNAEDLEAPVVYQESWERDAWQRFSYKFFFESVVLYPPEYSALRRTLALWWSFISTTYTLTYVFLAVYFDGETQLFSLVIAGASYIFFTMLVFPYRAPYFAENIFLHLVLLVQLNLFYQLVQDKSELKYIYAIAGLQLAALPLKMALTSVLSDDEAYVEHRDRAREEDLGKPARPAQKLMRGSSSATLHAAKQRKRLDGKKRRRKGKRRLDRQNTSATAINLFGEGAMI